MERENVNMNGIEIGFGDASLSLFRIRIETEESDTISYHAHAHSCFEIHVIQKGDASFLIQNTEVPVSEGQVLIIRPNAEHISYLGGEECKYIVLDLLLKKQEGESGFYSYFCTRLEELSHRAFDVTEELYQEMLAYERAIAQFEKKRKNFFEEYCRLKKMACSILVGLTECQNCTAKKASGEAEESTAQKGAEAQGEDEKLLLLGEFVNHAHTPIAEIAEKLGYSERHTARMIRQMYGQSLGELRYHQKLVSAKRFLRDEPELSLVEIALQSGFSDLGSMNRAFLKTEKCTPNEYRKQVEPKKD